MIFLPIFITHYRYFQLSSKCDDATNYLKHKHIWNDTVLTSQLCPNTTEKYLSNKGKANNFSFTDIFTFACLACLTLRLLYHF